MTVYQTNPNSLYYIEFNDEMNEVTLYMRHFFVDPEEFEELKNSKEYHPFMTNEGHPYQIFRLPVPPLGCIPDVSWYKWMVDKLNSSL